MAGRPIDAGYLQIGYGGSSGTLGRGCVTNNANLVFNRIGFLPVTNQISCPGALFQNGAGTVALYGPNTYTGSTTVNAGTLLVNGAIAGGPVIFTNAALPGFPFRFYRIATP